MKYKNIKQGIFISRPNRFIANIEIDGIIEVCHVKNTGRCKELLIPGVKVFVEESSNPNRKTKYDLIAVQKDESLINMDSQAPNSVFGEWVKLGGYFNNLTYIKPEFKYKNSRFDFYLEADGKKILIEVKGVTLENNGVVLFPDAPTERGVKHLNELIDASKNGYQTYIFFIVQMEKCSYFTPNVKTHKEFADTLIKANENGVNIKALNCKVSNDSLEIKGFIDVKL